MKRKIIQTGIAVFSFGAIAFFGSAYGHIQNQPILTNNLLLSQAKNNKCSFLKEELRKVNLRISVLEKEVNEVKQYLTDANSDRNTLKDEISSLQDVVRDSENLLREASQSGQNVDPPVKRPVLPTEVRETVATKIEKRIKSKILGKTAGKVFKVITKPPNPWILAARIFLNPSRIGYEPYQISKAQQIIQNLTPKIQQHSQILNSLEQKIKSKRKELSRLSKELQANVVRKNILNVEIEQACQERIPPSKNCRSERGCRVLAEPKILAVEIKPNHN